jgi:hypothetical protein
MVLTVKRKKKNGRILVLGIPRGGVIVSDVGANLSRSFQSVNDSKGFALREELDSDESNKEFNNIANA